MGAALPSQLTLVRFAVGLGGFTMCILMFGPFQGLEERLGLNDKAAHIAAFYLLTVGLFACAPRFRRTDIGLGVILLAGLSEVIQFFVGRSMSFGDFAADSVGILGAMLPATVERFRYANAHRPSRLVGVLPNL